MSIIQGPQLMQIMQNTLNKIDPRLIDHGARIAYMVWNIACLDATLTSRELRDITITSFLHDVGAYKTDEIERMVEFETSNVFDHSIYGYLFAKYLTPLKDYSNLILCHHVPYHELKKFHFIEYKWIQILSICDRYDVAMSTHDSITATKELLYKSANILFDKNLLDLFFYVNDTQHFIEEIYIDKKEIDITMLTNTKLTDEELSSYLDMISYSIDFRSRFMITHTMTTNRISIKLALLLGLSSEDIEKINQGSILHDLGKVAIPNEILDYPGKLDEQQMAIMRSHVVHTGEILDHLLEEDVINIATRHHEKLNGGGYPLGLCEKNLSTNDRIVAVADIISALYEQRSYKQALDKTTILNILNKNVENGSIDKTIVSLAILHYDEIIDYIHVECDPMIDIYNSMTKMYEHISANFYEYLSLAQKNITNKYEVK